MSERKNKQRCGRKMEKSMRDLKERRKERGHESLIWDYIPLDEVIVHEL